MQALLSRPTVSKAVAPRPLDIIASGRYLPGEPVSSESLDLKLGLRSGTLEGLSGVRQRHISRGENAAQMGAKAARAALAEAGLRFQDVDLLLCVSGSPDQIVPSNAALMLAELDTLNSGIPAFDINSTCLSFVVGLDTIAYAMGAGRYERVLLVASELPSLGMNPKEPEAFGLFGDGAAAVLVQAGKPGQGPRILASAQESYASGVKLCEIYGGAGRMPSYEYGQHPPERYLFHMDGTAMFKLASRVLPGFLKKLLAQAGLTLDEIDVVIPHQASLTALEILRRKLGIAEDKLMCTLPEWGNTIAASIPLALDEARRQKRLTPGKRALLLGTSAGFSVGGMVLEF